MKKIIILLILINFLMANNSKYCQNNTNNRKTIIYVDESSVNSNDYINNLVNNLKHTFIPHEKVQIFFINPKTSEIKEMFNSCVPILSKKEIETIHKKGGLYLFGGNPIEQANEDLMFFYSYMKKVLKKAIHKNMEVDSKNLIELLYNESNKFENPLNRIIIVSDMMQNSEDISKNNILKLSKDKLIPKIKDYQTNFNYSNVYILITKKELRSSDFKKLKTFWQLYFDINNANMKSFNVGLDSVLSKTNQLITKKYEGNISYPDNSSIIIQLLFNYLQNGKINNGWLIINELDNVPFKGKIKLFDNKPKKAIFKITSKELGIHNFTNGEILRLKFIGKNIKGTLEMDNTDLIIITPKGTKLTNPNIKITLKEIE